MKEIATNAAVFADMLAPSRSPTAELREPAAYDPEFRQAGEFRIKRRQGLKNFVAKLRLTGLRGALLGCPAARL